VYKARVGEGLYIAHFYFKAYKISTMASIFILEELCFYKRLSHELYYPWAFMACCPHLESSRPDNKECTFQPAQQFIGGYT